MKRCFALSLCAVALAAFTLSDARADDIDLTLEYNPSGSTWELYAEVVSGGTADGSLGISAVRALLTGIDFGTNGDAVTIAGGIGAINPVDDGGGNQRPPVLDLGGGVIEVLYGQDISATGTIVGGVGVGGRDLIASGSYSSVPAFGADGALTSQGLFLTSTTPGGGNAIDPDNTNLDVVEVGTGCSGILGDINCDTNVDGLDIQPFVDLVTGGAYQFEGDIAPVGAVDGVVDGLDIQPFVNIVSGLPPVSGLAAASVPEPTSIAMMMLAGTVALGVRRR